MEAGSPARAAACLTASQNVLRDNATPRALRNKALPVRGRTNLGRPASR
jgi:hypothetical protein